MNNNRICEPEPFVNNLSLHFPNLQRFSMLGNPFDPVQLPDHVYWNFRVFVSSRFPKLIHLDWKEVTQEERDHSKNLFEEDLPLQIQASMTPTNSQSWDDDTSNPDKILVLD